MLYEKGEKENEEKNDNKFAICERYSTVKKTKSFIYIL